MLGGKTGLPLLVAIVGITIAGSLVITIGSMPEPEKQLIAVQNVEGKVNTNIPVSASRSFSTLPVVFDLEDPALTAGAEEHGTDLETEQKLVINIISDTAEPVKTVIDLNNKSEDTQLVLFKVSASPHITVDIAPDTGFDGIIDDPGEIDIAGVVGHNEWLLSVASGNDKTIEIESSPTDPGAYSLVLELLRVG